MAALDTRPDEKTPGPPPRTVYLIGAVILAALIVFAIVAALAWPRMNGQRAEGTAHTATGDVHGRDHATLDLVTGTTSVTVQAADLGDTLYKVESPQTPSVTDTDDRIEVHVTGGDASVTIRLNRDVRWTVRFTAGSQSNTADLRDLKHLAGVEYVGGVSAIDLTLPKPAGTIPVRVDGGASAVRVHAPNGAPVQVKAGGGAGRVAIDGEEHNGITAGATFNATGWDTANDRYTVDAAAGVSTITVDRY
ncbi:hypothetical protein ACQP00_10800 [Dactylosporangium sp. CS-047395]|uniref:hypothetical protein n=1 Tax=Dactylosporangium sp. CS-047395 TaxID=3239936 RepID=UPI003D8FDFDE